ncbi:syntaxin 5 [Rhodnius prolixus]
MSARRRRVGSESEQQPLILIDNLSQQLPQSSNFPGSRLVETSDNNEKPNKTYLKHQDQINRPNMSRDRTAEFSNAIRSLQGRHVIRAIATQDPVRAKTIQSYGEFMMLARTIGKNISSTYAKLEKLTLLAKRKPLFNDQPTEIQELTYMIKEDLGSLNNQIAKLQEIVRRQNEARQSTKSQHLCSHSSTVVLSLQAKLASMSSQFKQVLELRTENLKEAKRRREQFSQGPVSTSLPAAAVAGQGGSNQGSVLLAAQNDHSVIDLAGSTVAGGRNHNSPSYQQQMMIAYDDHTDQYLSSRAEAMQNIESTIVELGGIFQQLAHMVKEQEEMVDRIDANVADTELNVEAAHREILKYFQSVTSNRWLMIKIFGVLIFFFMFFLVFMA